MWHMNGGQIQRLVEENHRKAKKKEAKVAKKKDQALGEASVETPSSPATTEGVQETAAKKPFAELWGVVADAATQVIEVAPQQGREFELSAFKAAVENFLELTGVTLFYAEGGELDLLQRVAQDAALLKRATAKVEKAGGVSRKNADVALCLAEGLNNKKIAKTLAQTSGKKVTKADVADRVKTLKEIFGCTKKELVHLLKTANQYTSTQHDVVSEILPLPPEKASKTKAKAEPKPA